MIWLPAVLALTVAQPHAYVGASSANVRALKSETAEIVGRLRINTQVTIEPADGGWSQVTFGDVTGFVRSTLLVAKPIVFADAMKTARTAKKPADALQWAERAFALEPFDRSAMELLRDLHRAAGRKKQAAEMEGLLAGKRATYFAVCRQAGAKQNLAVLFAAIDSTGAPNALVDPTALLPELSVAAWWHLSESNLGGSLPEGFPRARIERAEAVEEPIPEPLRIRMVLGECDSAGTIYATAPIAHPEYRAFDWSTTPALASSLAKLFKLAAHPTVRIASISSSVVGPGLTDVTAEVVEKKADFANIAPARAKLWTLLNAKGEALTQIGNAGESFYEGVDEKHWLTVGGLRVALLFHTAWAPESASSSAFTIIVVDKDGKLRSASRQLDHSGC